jgi:hypothetical protein
MRLVSISEADRAAEGSNVLFRKEHGEETAHLFFAGPWSGVRAPMAKAAGKCRPLEEEYLF